MPQQAQKSASIFLIIKYIKHLQLSTDTYHIPLPFAMTIISSNMIGHFLVHSSILPSRSSPSALVAEVEKAPCRPIEELLRETWRTFPLSPIDPRNDEDKRPRQEYWQWCWYWLKLVLWMFSKMGEHHTPTPFSTHSLTVILFFYLLSINFLNEYILTSEDSARALRTYKNKCTRGN